MKEPAALHKIARNEVPIADYVPMGVHIAPDLIKLRNSGDYIAIWKLDGIPFETTEFDELNARKEALNNFLRTLGGGHFALWSHKVRRLVDERLPGKFTNPFCTELDRAYQHSFDTYRMLATELYLTLVYRPKLSKVNNIFRRVTAPTLEQIARDEQACLDVMDDLSKQIASSLAKYSPERLTTFTRNGLGYSAMASFLGFLINGVWEDIPLRRASLNEYLPTSRLHFGDHNGMLQIEHPLARKFVGFLDFQDYPKFSEVGMNNAILYGDYEYIESQSFSILNKRDAIAALERQRGQLISSEDASQSEIAEMDLAADHLQSGLIEMGEYHYNLAVFGDTLEQTAKHLAEARATFDEPGFKMAVIDVVPECAWFAQLPGNWAMRPREASITSYNFACLSPLHNFSVGKRDGNPWGSALSLLKTPSAQPYYFNFHASPEDRDTTDEKYPGNTSVLGSTGVGKTTVITFLLAQSDRFNPRIVAFDKDRGMEIAIRAMGGKYTTFRRGEPTGCSATITFTADDN